MLDVCSKRMVGRRRRRDENPHSRKRRFEISDLRRQDDDRDATRIEEADLEVAEDGGFMFRKSEWATGVLKPLPYAGVTSERSLLLYRWQRDITPVPFTTRHTRRRPFARTN